MISNPRRPSACLAAAAACLLAAAGTAAGPQETASPEAQEAFFEQIAVNIVNVEVYVRDKEGNPITDLGADDFEVLEDGRPVEVLNFYRVAGGRHPVEPEPEQEPQEQPEGEAAPPAPGEPTIVETRIEQLPVPESQRLNVVVYVDNYNIHPLNRNRVFGRLRAFLRDTLTPDDRVMVASYDRSLHIEHPFTSDVNLINRKLLELERKSANAVLREAERTKAVKAIIESDSLHAAQFQAKTFAEDVEFETEAALDALREMLDSLAGLPGRKMLLHLSDGLPMIPGQDLYQAIQQRYADISAMSQSLARDLSRDFMQLVAHANTNRVSFYTIDAGGLRTQSLYGAENPAINTRYVVGNAIEGVRAKNLQRSLLLMAEQTGGQSVMNTNDVGEGLERFGRDFGNYYSLGYRAPVSDRGRYHKIQVRLKSAQKGWQLRHRDGYRDKSIDAQVADGVQAYLVHGYQSNPLGVSIEIGQQAPGEDERVEVAIRVRVPVEKIVLLPRGGYYEGRLRLYFSAIDSKGRGAPLQELPFELRIPESAVEVARRDQVARVFNLTMRRGPHTVVVAVRDELSEERSIMGRRLVVQ